jgi:spoIIIJ-associated protein
MKDQVFSATDVPSAVALASRSLGLPADRLRYVVLDAGQPGTLGMQDRPAQIAVLVGGAPPVAAQARSAPNPSPAERPARVRDLAGELRSVVRELARALEADLSAEVTPEAGGLLVRIGGSAATTLDAAVVEALTHLLQKAGAREDTRVPVIVEVGGRRRGRDEELREKAMRLAEDVKRDGKARETQALNAYERRIVHMTLDGDAQVETYSVGEGDARRVRIDRRAEGSATELM